MPKKQNKIIVAVSTDERERKAMLQRITIDLGFAFTPADASKIIRNTPQDFDLVNTYFVLASSYNLRESPLTTHRLYELAARGIAVVVGVKRLYPEHEFMCVAYYPSDFGRL
ncbi:hypothetical protein AAA214_06000 [Parabacteroides goldsteinii]|uniref:hypothetical protein n=1 Tax=Parabacteroides goldsteinii TaxID=328812 RepID=UPI0032C17CCF